MGRPIRVRAFYWTKGQADLLKALTAASRTPKRCSEDELAALIDLGYVRIVDGWAVVTTTGRQRARELRWWQGKSPAR
jgi:hypothetical protein